MTVFPMLTYDDTRPANHRETMLGYVRSAMRRAVREAYDMGLNDGRKWIGNGADNPYNGQGIETELGDPLFDFVKEFASARSMPGRGDDLTTFDDISEALDAAEIPRDKKDVPLTVLERVEHLAYALEEEMGYTEELRSAAETVSNEFEGDLWKANRRILERLKFDWSGIGSEGVTAEQVEDFIMDAVTHLERQARPAAAGRRFKQTDDVEGATA